MSQEPSNPPPEPENQPTAANTNNQRSSPPQPPLSSSSTQPSGQQVQQVLRAQSIRVLRRTVDFLEGVLAKLESEQLELTDQTAASSVLSWISQGVTRLKPLGERIQVLWAQLLSWARPRLPESIRQKLSDRTLGGAIAGILVLFFWLTLSLLPGKAPEVATQPPSRPVVQPTPQPAPQPDLVAPPELNAPEAPAPVVVTPPVPEPVFPTPEPETPPITLKNLSPEQTLIAAIQTQMSEITNQYPNLLVTGVQASFQKSWLVVQLNMGWYELSQAQQDKVAAALFQRSKELDFSRLEIADSQESTLR